MKKNITLVLNAVVIIIMMCMSIFISGTYTSAEENNDSIKASIYYKKLDEAIKEECKLENIYFHNNAYLINRIVNVKINLMKDFDINDIETDTFVKVPMKAFDNKYGIATFKINSDNDEILSYEFVGETYDCANSSNYINNFINEVQKENSLKKISVDNVELFEMPEEKIIIAKINTGDKYHYVICKEENFTRSEYSDSDLQTLTEKEINESCENTIQNQNNDNKNNTLNNGFVYWSNKGTIISYCCLILILFSIVFIIVCFIRKIRVKWLYIIDCMLLLVSVAVWGINYRNNGIKNLEYPLINGDNTEYDSSEIKSYINRILKDYKEVAYEKNLDPGQQNGNRNATEIVLNNGEKITVVSNDEYMVIREGNDTKMYRMK